jgi:hypothetical protein
MLRRMICRPLRLLARRPSLRTSAQLQAHFLVYVVIQS